MIVKASVHFSNLIGLIISDLQFRDKTNSSIRTLTGNAAKVECIDKLAIAKLRVRNTNFTRQIKLLIIAFEVLS